jgi:hypothetical protein
MIRRPSMKSALIAAAIGTQFLSIGMLAAHAQNKASASASASASTPATPENAVRPEFGKLLLAAQELGRAGKYPEALAKLGEADAMQNKTPYENYMIERVRGPVAAAAGQDAIATKSLETVLASERGEAADKQRLMSVLATVYFRQKNYPKTIEWASRYIKEGGADENTRNMLARAYYLSNDFAHAAQLLRAEIEATEKAGKQPAEDQLRILASSLLKQNDRAGYGEVLERLVALYPTKDYWGDLLARLFSKTTFSDRLLLDAYRLKFATGDMDGAKEYLDMAELATRAGFPAETKKVLDQGFQAGVLGTGADAAKHKKLRDAAAKSVADDQKTMAQGEADAAKKKDGTGLVNLGYAFVTAGQPEKGLGLMEQGIQKGGLKHPEDAKLHVALAYAQAGKKDEAIEKLKAVQGADGTAELARYWTIYLKQAK